MNRLNVRIRTRLFQSLLRQEIGFFDVTKSGNFFGPFRTIAGCGIARSWNVREEGVIAAWEAGVPRDWLKI